MNFITQQVRGLCHQSPHLPVVSELSARVAEYPLPARHSRLIVTEDDPVTIVEVDMIRSSLRSLCIQEFSELDLLLLPLPIMRLATARAKARKEANESGSEQDLAVPSSLLTRLCSSPPDRKPLSSLLFCRQEES